MRNKFVLYTFMMMTMIAVSCKKFIQVPQPPTSVTKEFVFSSDANAISAMLGVYSGFSANSFYIGIQNLANWGTAADELKHFTATDGWATNNILPNDATALASWNAGYKFIYNANIVLEGVAGGDNISAKNKSLLNGEAKFFRAFSYFYLTNMYGNTPLLLSTDYRINALAPRAGQEQVYQQIISDLKDAQIQLSADYLDANNAVAANQERVRGNKAAATALLARVYLYRKDYVNAEIEASKVIDDRARYDTVSIANVFLKNNKEAIWQVPPYQAFTYTNNAGFILTAAPSTSKPYWFQNDFINSFEPGDKRKTSWIGSFTAGAATYYFPYKYKTPTGSTLTSPTEYNMVLRLAEQYLIRAEARIQQGGAKLALGIEDLNLLRKRARERPTVAVPNPLPALPDNLSPSNALLAVENERRHELFTEGGHRWFDLVRTDRANALLGQLKGTNWQTTDQLVPVPITEIEKNQNLLPQNPGYN